jgi:hypothetical protein
MPKKSENQKNYIELNEAIKKADIQGINKTLSKAIDLSEIEEKFDDSLVKNLIDQRGITQLKKTQILNKLIDKNLNLYVFDKNNGNSSYVDYLIDKLWNVKYLNNDVIRQHYYNLIEIITKNAPKLQKNYTESDLNPIGKALTLDDSELLDLLVDTGSSPYSSLPRGEHKEDVIGEIIRLRDVTKLEKLLNNPKFELKNLDLEETLILFELGKKHPKLAQTGNYELYFQNLDLTKVKEELIDNAINLNDINFLKERLGKDWVKEASIDFLKERAYYTGTNYSAKEILNKGIENQVIKEINEFLSEQQFILERIHRFINDNAFDKAKRLIENTLWDQAVTGFPDLVVPILQAAKFKNQTDIVNALNTKSAAKSLPQGSNTKKYTLGGIAALTAALHRFGAYNYYKEKNEKPEIVWNNIQPSTDSKVIALQGSS